MATVSTDYLWMVVTGGIACFTMGFGIGANDVANNFGSSVGSGAIRFRWAVLIAACFELIGSVGFGSSVTDSVRSGVIDPHAFVDRPDILMFGNFSALMAGTMWLLWASKFGMPVSTTHTIVGALFGVGLATGDMSIINWSYMGSIVISWVISPVLSCFLAILLFTVVRQFILRSNNPLKRAKNSLGILLFCLSTVLALFFVLKNPSLSDFAENTGYAILAAIVCGLVVAVVVTPIMQYVIKKKQIKRDEGAAAAQAELEKYINEDGDVPVKRKGSTSSSDLSSTARAKRKAETGLWDSGSDDSEFQCTEQIKKRWYALPIFMDLHVDALNEDLKAAAVHDKAEKFPVEVESYFSFLQIISACMSCIVHGSNDVANATAPFATVYGIYRAGQYEDNVATPYWLLALGGSAIGVGVLFLGHHVIQSIGIKLVKITPSRGFSIEISMSLIMVLGSMLGFPLSTTHCQVGATVGVGLIDKHEDVVSKKSNCGGLVNWNAVNGTLIGKIVVAWIATLVIAAVLAAAIFAFGVYAPEY